VENTATGDLKITYILFALYSLAYN
jgi:hypothetical protein